MRTFDDSLTVRGWGPFRQYEIDDQWIDESVTVIELQWDNLSAWVVPSGSFWRLALLQLWYGDCKGGYWRFVRLLWSAGLLEPHPSRVFSWRRDFRPFPWKGRRRRHV